MFFEEIYYFADVMKKYEPVVMELSQMSKDKLMSLLEFIEQELFIVVNKPKMRLKMFVEIIEKKIFPNSNFQNEE
jgi:hypothetical protein